MKLLVVVVLVCNSPIEHPVVGPMCMGCLYHPSCMRRPIHHPACSMALVDCPAIRYADAMHVLERRMKAYVDVALCNRN